MSHSEVEECTFPEVEIEEREAGGLHLKVGMMVLTPCECGRTPYEALNDEACARKELEKALAAVEPFRPLYHWAPASRRKQIIRYGLRPGMKTTTNVSDDEWKAPYICFGDSPSWAWALSGAQRGTAPGEYDLWMTDLSRLTEPALLESTGRPTGLHEVRTAHRVYKRDLWYAGSRIK